jgi:hypothetical protein
LGLAPRIRAAITGRKISATASENISEVHSGQPSSPNMIRICGFLLMNISGKNTTMIVNVDKSTASATSRVPPAAEA